LILEKLVVGDLQTNCYVVGDEVTLDGLIIDPGGDAAEILKVVEGHGLRVKYVLNTHGHFDHILANRQVMEATHAPLAVHPDDAAMLTNPLRSFSVFMGNLQPSPPATVLLKEGQVLEIGSIRLTVLHTPGHSPGSISLWYPEQKLVFSGDALFNMGIGRTDFPGGSFKVLAKSIQEQLFTLPDDTVVHPGHGPETTIGFERAHNPFVS
jgi:hydroxyacylglutathione hydrolase